MGHYLSEMESPDDARRRMDEAALKASYREAGYESFMSGPYLSSPTLYSHEPCGLAVTVPKTHDGLCPANGRGRTTPRLG